MVNSRPPKMSRYKAEMLLGLTGAYSYKDFQRAYRAAVKENHPDVGGDATAMVEVNQAKDAIEYCFGDDKSQTFTVSASQGASVAEQTAEENACWQEHEQDEATRRAQHRKDGQDGKQSVWREAVEFAREHGFKFGFNGSLNPDKMTDKQRDYWSNMIFTSTPQHQNMFSPTRMGFDLRGKPQSEWGDAEWASFKSFKVPDIEYGNNDTPGTFAYWYFNAQVDDSGYFPRIIYKSGETISEWEESNNGVWRLDNIDATDWTDDDWFYYWYANFSAEPIVVDGIQHAHVISRDTRHLNGPWAQREHAKAQPDYSARQRAYKNKAHSCIYRTPVGAEYDDGFRIETFYGDVTVEGSYLAENVGVPFAYATADFFMWQQFNRERLDGVPADDDWTGLEFLLDEDRSAQWIIDLGLQDKIARLHKQRAARKEGESKEWRKGIAHKGFLAQHPSISAWLFVFSVYTISMYAAGAIVPKVMGVSIEEAVSTIIGVEVAVTVISIIIRNKVIRWLRKIQRRVSGKA